MVGRAVELFGNRVRMDGLTYSVDCPFVTIGHKSTLAFGLHEIEERELIKRWLPSNVPVIELGGGLGVVSCLVNRTLKDRKNHIVVEANPAMVPVLERNRNINVCGFEIVNKAIAYDQAVVRLNLDRDFVGSTIAGSVASNVAEISTTTIAKLMRFDVAGIVCDIEGAEAGIIERELPELGRRIQFFMAEMHPSILGEDRVNKLLKDLETLGFRLCEKMGDSVFYVRT